jgi:hypothetical protein
MLAVRWYLRVGLSYRDLEELLAERRINVDHVTLCRWVQRFTPLIAEAARPRRHRRSTARLARRGSLSGPRAGAVVPAPRGQHRPRQGHLLDVPRTR